VINWTIFAAENSKARFSIHEELFGSLNMKEKLLAVYFISQAKSFALGL
jgi:hypothetical protein